MAEAALDPTEQFSKMSREVIDPIQALPLKERAPKYQSAMAEMLPQQIQAGVNLEKAKSDRDIGVKQAGAEEGQRQTILQQNEMEAGLAKRDKHVMPTFTPTQEDLGTYAQLASSIATMGLLIGAGGKSSAKIAIASMTGMLKGWKEGRRDLYERESKNFEKESTRISNIRKDIQNDLNMAMRLWPTKRKDAIDLIETARYKAGTDSVLGAMLYKGNYDGAMKLLESARKTDEVRLKDEAKIEAAKVKAAFDAAIAKAKIASSESIAGRRIASSEAIAKARIQSEQEKSDDASRRQMFRLEAERQAKIRASDEKAKIASLKQVGRPTSATNERYANNVFRSSNEILRSLQLIESMGISGGGGILGNVVGKGTIPSEAQKAIGQYFTTDQEKMYNTAASGMAYEMAMVLGGGYKPDVTTQTKIETYLAVGPNDTIGTSAYKFADVAAKLKAALEVAPAYSEDQKKSRTKLLEDLNKYASPEEVYARVYGPGKEEEPLVRGGAVSEPKTKQDFDAITSGSLYKDPDDNKIYRKR